MTSETKKKTLSGESFPDADCLPRDQYWSKNPMNSDTWYDFFVPSSLGVWSFLDADCLRRDQYWSKNPLNSDTWYGLFVSLSLGGGGG